MGSSVQPALHCGFLFPPRDILVLTVESLRLSLTNWGRTSNFWMRTKISIFSPAIDLFGASFLLPVLLPIWHGSHYAEHGACMFAIFVLIKRFRRKGGISWKIHLFYLKLYLCSVTSIRYFTFPQINFPAAARSVESSKYVVEIHLLIRMSVSSVGIYVWTCLTRKAFMRFAEARLRWNRTMHFWIRYLVPQSNQRRYPTIHFFFTFCIDELVCSAKIHYASSWANSHIEFLNFNAIDVLEMDGFTAGTKSYPMMRLNELLSASELRATFRLSSISFTALLVSSAEQKVVENDGIDWFTILRSESLTIVPSSGFDKCDLVLWLFWLSDILFRFPSVSLNDCTVVSLLLYWESLRSSWPMVIRWVLSWETNEKLVVAFL